MSDSLKQAVLRFWSHTKTGPVDQCWLFTGDRNEKGYGRITVGGEKFYAHRFSYAIHHNLPLEKASDIILRHTCDVTNCVNPMHLILGTRTDNIADKVSRNRQLKGSSMPTSKLNENDVRLIMHLHLDTSYTQTAIAQVFDVSIATINDIVKGRTWRHVTGLSPTHSK